MSQPHALQVRVLRGSDGGATVVHAAGELDYRSIDRLRAVLLPLVEEGAVVLDGAGITFCDSSGLHAILQANREARLNATEFRVAAPPGPLTRVMELAGALDVVAVFPDTQAALAQ